MLPSSPQSDERLVAAVLGGDRAQFEPLLERHQPAALRLARRLLGDADEAADVAQEAALQAFLSLDRLREPERFGAWLCAIAANLARTALRRRRASSLEALEALGLPLALSAQPLGMSPLAAPPDEAAVQREIHAAIVAAIGELSPANREAVLGFFVEGYSYRDLADLLRVPLSAVKGRLFKSRRQLQQRLRPLADEILSQRKEPVMPAPALIRLRVAELYAETWAHRRIVLASAEGHALVLRAGPAEADAIAAALQGQRLARPQTHDLTLQLMGALGARLERVVIDRLAEHVYVATLELRGPEGALAVEGRHGDAIALALRAGAPIFVPAGLLAALGQPLESVQSGPRAGRASAGAPPPARPAAAPAFAELVERLAPTAETVGWQGRPMTALRLAAGGSPWLSLRLPEGEPAWLLVPPDHWERTRALAADLAEEDLWA